MKLPVDVKQLVKAAGDIASHKGAHIAVELRVDPSAPDDLRECVRGAFTAASDQASVGVRDVDDATPVASGLDLVVVAAGFSKRVGSLCAQARAAGAPALVATTMPQIVVGTAREQGAPLDEHDVVTCGPVAEDSEFDADDDFNQEPLPLTVDRAASLRLAMGAWVVDVFRDKRAAFAQCFPFVRFPLANELVNATAAQNAGVGFVVIIPGADLPVMTANQMKLVLQIASVYGADLGVERLRELGPVLAGAFGWRALARELCDLVPGLGWALKAGVGYAGTQAVGRAAIAYFEGQAGECVSFAAAASPVRAKAAALSREAREQSTAVAGALAVARDVAADAKDAASGIAGSVVPKARKAVEQVSGALGTTPEGLGRAVVEGVADAVSRARGKAAGGAR